MTKDGLYLTIDKSLFNLHFSTSRVREEGCASEWDYVSQSCVHLIVEIVFCLMRLPGNGCLQLGLISESSKIKIKKINPGLLWQTVRALHLTN